MVIPIKANIPNHTLNGSMSFLGNYRSSHNYFSLFFGVRLILAANDPEVTFLDITSQFIQLQKGLVNDSFRKIGMLPISISRVSIEL